MENQFKKRDAQGNKLPEQIGKGIDEIHLKIVLDARKEVKKETLSFKVEEEQFNKFKSIPNNQELLRAFVRGIIKQKGL